MAPCVTLYLGCPAIAVRQRGLARAIGTHQGMGLSGVDGQIDAAQDLPGTSSVLTATCRSVTSRTLIYCSWFVGTSAVET